jgi:hypothetical protein
MHLDKRPAIVFHEAEPARDTSDLPAHVASPVLQRLPSKNGAALTPGMSHELAAPLSELGTISNNAQLIRGGGV